MNTSCDPNRGVVGMSGELVFIYNGLAMVAQNTLGSSVLRRACSAHPVVLGPSWGTHVAGHESTPAMSWWDAGFAHQPPPTLSSRRKSHELREAEAGAG